MALQLLISSISGDSVGDFQVDGSDTVEYLKTMIETSNGIPRRRQCFLWNGTNLENEVKLADCAVDEAVINLTLVCRSASEQAEEYLSQLEDLQTIPLDVIRNIPRHIRTDPDILLAVIERRVSTIGYDGFQQAVHCFNYPGMHRDDILAVVKEKPDLFKFIIRDCDGRPTPWESDEEILFASLRGGATDSFKRASATIRQDKAITLAAVQIDGDVLEFVDRKFKDDEEVVQTAVGQKGTALQFASPRLREKRATVLKALRQDPNAWRFVLGWSAKRLASDPKMAAARNVG